MEISKRHLSISLIGLMVLGLAACGSDDSSDGSAAAASSSSTSSSSSAASSASSSAASSSSSSAGSAFTESASWSVTLPASGSSVCYDFNAKVEVAGCTGTAWDVKLTSAGRSASLYTNSGESGSGNGAALGSPFAFTWTGLQAWQNATTDPVSGVIPSAAWMSDSANTVFSGSNSISSAIFEYGLNSTHLLYPTYRTFLITTASSSASATGSSAAPVFALQVTGYYGGATGTASGYPSLRWIDRSDANATVQTATVDASASGTWVYYDLINKTTTTAGGSWHIAFNRYSAKLNGGTSGSGTVAGYLAKTPSGFYNSDGSVIESALMAATPASTLADLSASDLAVPASASAWKKDSIGSLLSPAYTGSYPNALNFGWYTYYPTDAAAAVAGLTLHMLSANPEAATIVRGGEGNTYARMRLRSISYATATPAYSGQQTWVFDFQVQPAP